MKLSTNFLLIAPALAILCIFMLVPLGYGIVYSFLSADTYGGVRLPFSLEAYQQVFVLQNFDGTVSPTTIYLRIIVRSLVLATATAVVCAALALPIAWYIATRPKVWRTRLIFIVTLPFWVNSLIRTYCWVLLLRDQGLINQTLMQTGIASEPYGLMYNNTAILIGLVYNFLPFMILPIYSALERVDFQIIEAGHDLYAPMSSIYKRIIYPLAKPGIQAGTLMVFAPAIGFYLIPDMLGGGQNMMIGNLIQLQFTSGRNWPFGAALAMIITASVLIVLMYGAIRPTKKGAASQAKEELI